MSSTKKFFNKTKFDLYVTLYTRAGAALHPNGVQPPPFTIPAGGAVKVSYDADNLNAINYSWTDSNTRCVSEQEVLEIGCWWDKVINYNNNTITFNSVSRDNITGSNPMNS